LLNPRGTCSRHWCNSTRLLAADGSKLVAKGNCRFLLGGLVTLLVAFPFPEDVAKPLVLVIPLTRVFAAAVVVADAEPRHIRRAILLAAIQGALTMASRSRWRLRWC
jgi:hypothetical protein